MLVILIFRQLCVIEYVLVTVGCHEQAGVESCPSLQPGENNIDVCDTLREVCDGNTAVAFDSHLAISSNTKTASLHSAAEAVDSSVTEELCLYTCDVCNRQFSAGDALRSHRRRHKHCASCADCGHSFYSAGALRRHLLTQCPSKSVTCNICCESFNGWQHLSRHTTVSHSEANVCLHCGQAFLRIDQLVAHRSVHATNAYQCRTCSRCFHSQRRAKRHIRKHVIDTVDGHASESYLTTANGGGHISEGCVNPDSKVVAACDGWLTEVNGDVCLSGYNMNEIIKGIDVSYQENSVSGTAYVSKSQLKVDEALQPDPNRPLAHRLMSLPLPGCSLSSGIAAANGHTDGRCIILCFDKPPLPNCVSVENAPEGVATVTGTSHERVTCAECSRSFKRLSDLHVHMQRHTGEMRYKCSVCDRPFRKSGTLARHMRIHTGERPYVCETCGKSYKLLFHLHLHMAVHSSDRPFSCDVCGKAFQSAAGLKTHRFVHSGVKPFPCPICMRLFNRRSNMHAHLRVHDAARQPAVFGQEHVCILCRKKFGSTASLHAHLQTHAHQIQMDVGETITADDSADSCGKEMTYCKVERQDTEDVYVALPLVDFDDFDVG